MSYCVNCGVELDSTAQACPLCHTPVFNPNELVDRKSPTPFPVERSEVPLAAKWELAILISAMLASGIGVLRYSQSLSAGWGMEPLYHWRCGDALDFPSAAAAEAGAQCACSYSGGYGGGGGLCPGHRLELKGP